MTSHGISRNLEPWDSLNRGSNVQDWLAASKLWGRLGFAAWKATIFIHFPAYIKFWYSYLMLFVLVLPVFHPTQFWPWRSRSLAHLYIHKILRSSYLLAQEILFVVLVLCLFAVCGCLAWQLLQFSALLRQERSVRQFGPRAGLGLLIAYLFGISCGSTVILYWGILGKWLVQNKPCQRYNEI